MIALVNHLWQSTCFALAAALITLAFRNNRAHVRYSLWLSASVKFLVPFALLMTLGSRIDWSPRLTSPTQSVPSTILQISRPFPETFTAATPARTAHHWFPDVLLGIWACGFSGIALIRFRAWRRIRAALRSSAPVDLPAAVSVRAAPGLLEPGVVGIFRPVLLLPVGIAGRLTPRQLEAILAHELSHIRRRDNLTSSIHMIVEAVFWFHPLVWWIGARLLEERERACDEAVLRLGNEPRDYAEAIVTICKLYVESPLVCVSGVTGANLKQRIQAILTGQIAADLNLAKKVALALTAALALAAPVFVGVINAPAIRAESIGTPKYEVASIRLGGNCPSGGVGKKKRKSGGGGNVDISSDRLTMECQTVASMIRMAYLTFALGKPFPIDPQTGSRTFPVSQRMLQQELKGAPGWIDSDRYTINAKAGAPQSREMLSGPMMQALLEDRFKLKVHRETREIPFYALTVANGGPDLQPAREPCMTESEMRAAIEAGQPFRSLKLACGAFFHRADGMVIGYRETMPGFTSELSFLLDRDVVDKTGISGVFDIQMQLTPEDINPRNLNRAPEESASEPVGASVFAAVKKLGLKLESTKAPAEFLVIDHIEKPTEN
jgi:bla regulator protein BlaR1